MALQEHGNADFGGSAFVRDRSLLWKKRGIEGNMAQQELGENGCISIFFLVGFPRRILILSSLRSSSHDAFSIIIKRRFRQLRLAYFFKRVSFFFLGWMDGRTKNPMAGAPCFVYLSLRCFN